VVTRDERSARGSSFFEPRVLTDVTTDIVITNEEPFRPRGAALPLQDRRRSDHNGQRHRIRAGRLFLQSRLRPHLARGRGLEYGIADINEGIISIEIAPLGGTS
jgi:succinate-semialdehyde dehydrogenase/glutarate-semialdehyde dehydrogenase